MAKQAPEFTATIEFYSTHAVISVDGVSSESEIYQARQMLFARGINASVVDVAGGKKALSVPVKTVNEHGNVGIMSEVKACFLSGSPRTALKPKPA